MKKKSKKRFRSLMLAAGLVSLGCNPTYAGLWGKAGTILGASTLGGFLEIQWRILQKIVDRMHLLMGTTPSDCARNKEWQALRAAYKGFSTSSPQFINAWEAHVRENRKGGLF